MSKSKLVLIKNIDTPHDEVTEEFTKLKESFPPGTQLSMFDIILSEEDSWFSEALEKILGETYDRRDN